MGVTPGPWAFAGLNGDDHYVIADPDTCNVAYVTGHGIPNLLDADAQFIVAACNAFLSAAKDLGVDPLELAEALEGGGIVHLVEVLRRASEYLHDGPNDGQDSDFRQTCKRTRDVLKFIPEQVRE